jgi:hypothetical protein
LRNAWGAQGYHSGKALTALEAHSNSLNDPRSIGRIEQSPQSPDVYH